MSPLEDWNKGNSRPLIKPRLIKLVALALGVVLAIMAIASSASAQQIAIISSDSLKSTKRAIRGTTSTIKAEHVSAKFHNFYLSGNIATDQETANSIRKLKPGLILTIGTSATQYAKTNFSNRPIVFVAVKYPALSGFVNPDGRPTKNVTGASLDIPPEIQFRYFKQVVPSLRKVGILYTSNTESLISPSKKVARRMGLELVPIQISHDRELPNAFDSLAKTVDGIWSLADPNIFTPQSTRFILLNSLTNGIPFMGFSRHVVESGALFALDFDYKAVGRQGGAIANRILNGGRVTDSPVTVPDFNWFHYNERTAEHLKITIPEELIAVAKEVYR